MVFALIDAVWPGKFKEVLGRVGGAISCAGRKGFAVRARGRDNEM